MVLAGFFSTAWWCHQMETFYMLLALCVGNSPVTGEFPAQRPVTRSFGVFFDLHLNKRSSKQSWGWQFEMPCAHYEVIVITRIFFFTGGQFWPSGIVVACVCVYASIHLCVYQSQYCPHNNLSPVQARIIKCDICNGLSLNGLQAITYIPIQILWKYYSVQGEIIMKFWTKFRYAVKYHVKWYGGL